jgi:hypothetical protein
MSRRLTNVFLPVMLLLRISSPLSSQALGAGYQLARSDHHNARDARGLAIRIRLPVPVDLRYDYLAANGERFESPCVGFVPPGCPSETVHHSTGLHSIFIAARARLFSFGSFQLIALPELGFVTGTIERRGMTSGKETSASGSAPGAGLSLELAAPRVGGSAFGGWVAMRLRGFVHPGSYAVDGYEPVRDLNGISSVELGVTYAVPSREAAAPR